MAAPAGSSERVAIIDATGSAGTRRSLSTRRAARAREEFRPDIQLLRALAVLAVVLFHLWPDRVTGGFVGVDVFFVISGFLITAHLLREVSETGRIRIGQFWARRAKRLLPAALLVLALTSVAALMVMPPTVLAQTLREALASIFYVENWALAQSSVDYLAADNIASPVQHFWTLSVEEQFYIALPLVMLGVAAWARRMKWGARRSIVVSLAILTALSFGYSIWLTSWSGATAYFSTATRMWEFGIGGLVGALALAKHTLVKAVAVTAGVAMILVAIAGYGAATPFPGYAAALPVLGTALVLYAGAGSILAAGGRLRPIAVIGGTSYAIYLWHWPPIVLLPYVTGHPLTNLEKVAILAGTFAVAWFSTKFWEDPIRFSPRLLGRARPRTVAIVMAVSMVAVAAIPASGLVVAAQDASNRALLAGEILQQDLPCFGAASMADPGCAHSAALEGVLLPAPEDAPNDISARPDCWSTGTDATLNVCTLGPASGYERHLLVVGDSHAKALLAGLEEVAEDRNWRIDLAGRAACYWTTHDLHQDSRALADACTEWRASLQEYVQEQAGLDAILAVKARRALADEVDIADPAVAMSTMVEGMASAWNARGDLDIPLIALVDNPRLTAETVDCVVRSGERGAQECALPLSSVMPPDGVREAVAIAENAHAIDLTHLYCDDLCRPVIGNVVVYRDGRHITDTYARTVAPYLADEIEALLSD
ncbi:acyltransferase family protein [Microbacterium sp.]|uniref:acyltransferase family protein n=1 Tax=Microbacterium sp. TaxID=51671 RepID=UPI0035B31276